MALSAEQSLSAALAAEPQRRATIEEIGGTSGVLHVAVDARTSERPSSEAYLEGLVAGLTAIRAPVKLTLIGRERELARGARIERWIDADADMDGSSMLLHASGIDLVHAIGSRAPGVRARRYLLTVHDVGDLMPAARAASWDVGRGVRRQMQKFDLGRAVRRNARIVVTSAKAKDELEAETPRLREAIWMIHSGPGRPGWSGALAAAQAPRADAGRAKRWFLTTGGTTKPENMDFLIAAMALWYRRRPEAPRLVWAGGGEAETEERWARIPARARRHIRVMTALTAETREQLFDEALGMVLPDLEPTHAYDALEAMRRGVPVMCARRRPFTDLLGQAPLWFDPRDSSTLWRSLDALLDDPVLYADAAHRSRREAERYDWRETAEMTLGAYRQLMRTFPG